jgi:sugar O-acyltransferase (sialic acid O-acetyltransferase NeuD family)
MDNIIIIGAGGLAREVAWLIEEINLVQKKWNLLGFYDETKISSGDINGYASLSKADVYDNSNSHFVIAIGDPEIRKDVFSRFSHLNYATLIHPDVKISNTNSIGKGTIICKGTIITVNVKIGKQVIINLDSTIGHDAVINDFVTILPSVNISGYVKIGKYTSVGTGTQIIQELEVGSNSVIGAGSVVVRDIEDYVVAVGLPAKAIKNRRK